MSYLPNVDKDVKNLFDEFPLKKQVSVPITKTVVEKVKNDFDNASIVPNVKKTVTFDSFSHSSEKSFIDVHEKKTPLTLDQAKAYILKNHYKTKYTGNHFIDERGRINVFTYSFMSSL